MRTIFFYKLLMIAALCCTVVFSVCIKDDDGAPEERDLPTLAVSNATVSETDEDQIFELKVRISGTHRTHAVVRVAAVSGTAVASADFEVLGTGQLVFAPGESQKSVAIKIIGDEVKETPETFTIRLFNPIHLQLSTDAATITIEDDDLNTANLVIPAGGYATPISYPGKTLVWADEFDGTEVNTNHWNFETGTGNNGWGNNELQYYRADNASIFNGNLVITAKKEKFGASNYTSARLTTKGKRVFKFGRIDIRAALPKGKGLWPALWMLGANIDVVSWPACGEIDIMELTGDLPSRILGTVHFGADVSQHRYISQSKYLSGNANFHDAFHVFSLNWEPDKIEFLVDDEVYHTITPQSLGTAAYPFNKPFFFIFNVAVGGTLPGNPDATTAFPQHMIVDYVRVFQ